MDATSDVVTDASGNKWCPFCRIVEGRDPDAQIVGQSDGWVAFFPLQPATRGHTLVVPRRHVRDFWDADASVVAELATACLMVGHALEDVLDSAGMNLITSAGEAAEQTVFHLHVHIVPRWPDDDIDRIWPPDSASDGAAPNELVQQVMAAIADRSSLG